MSRRLSTKARCALFVVASIVLSACIGEGNEGTEAPEVPTLTIIHQPLEARDNFAYEEDAPTGFTIRLAAAEVTAHELPEVLEFLGERDNDSARIFVDMPLYLPGGKPLPEQLDCFGPIELRDPDDQLVLTIDDFCPEGIHARLAIWGDINVGADPRWIFESPDGTVRVNFE